MSAPMANVEDSKVEDPAGDVRRWLLENHAGVLGTVNTGERNDGWPFLSVVPFALDARGQPLLQLADIAQHTRNAKADTRATLLVQEVTTHGDPQSGWRIGLLGSLAPVEASEADEALARFAERVPAAYGYSKMHDFALYRLHLQRVRYIGGFGKITWIDAAPVMRDPLGAGLLSAAPGAIAHMNADHAQSMIEMCEGLRGFKPERAQLVSLDRAGFLVRTSKPDRLVHFSFGHEIDAAGLRGEMVAMVARARKARSA
jgi:putative heme iron utilization protein